VPDTFVPTRDAGVEAEAGVLPRVDVPSITCTDTLTNVYVTPTLPPMMPANRGDIVRCAPDFALTLANVQSEVAAKGITTTMTSAVQTYRIAFRTTRGNGSDGVSTARVYLPQTPLALPLPVIVAGHPTDGLAPSTAPSIDPTSNEDLALPWAGLGYAVIVPDYAGLGNEGVQSYLDNHDQAYSLLDGARALRKMVSVGAFSLEVAISGYSQGGGAALSAQALASSYGCDGILTAVVAFAPEWPTRMNSFGFVQMLENPTELTIETGISYSVVEVMRTYSYFYNWVGPTSAGNGFPAAIQSGMDSAVMSMTEVVLGGYIQANAVHVADYIDPTLDTTLLDCIQKGATDSGCIDPGKSYYNFLEQNFVTADKAGAPVLFVQGLADYVMPPNTEAACNVDKLIGDGVTPQVCVDPTAQHTTVVGPNMDFVMQWVQAVLSGDKPPACTTSGVLPPCTP
jgi:dienelactone hydrolase